MNASTGCQIVCLKDHVKPQLRARKSHAVLDPHGRPDSGHQYKRGVKATMSLAPSASEEHHQDLGRLFVPFKTVS